MVRGHDHFDERFMVYAKYRANPILTINAMSYRMPREFGGTLERTPCVARWVPDELPEVHRLHVPFAVVDKYYGGPEGDDGG